MAQDMAQGTTVAGGEFGVFPLEQLAVPPAHIMS